MGIVLLQKDFLTLSMSVWLVVCLITNIITDPLGVSVVSVCLITKGFTDPLSVCVIMSYVLLQIV